MKKITTNEYFAAERYFRLVVDFTYIFSTDETDFNRHDQDQKMWHILL
jgi:hypothetical protein